MAEHLSKRELGDFLARLQQAALTGYPNPERKGCPGPQVLQEVANAPAPFAHPAYEHIKTCSPCLQEMLDMQGAVIRQRRTAAVRTRGVLVGCLALCVLLVFSVVFATHRDGRQANRPQVAVAPVPAVVMLDFRSVSSPRGADDASTESVEHVERKLVTLKIALPFGSNDGSYSIEIRDPTKGTALKTATGVAKILDGGTQLTVPNLDLSDILPGRYSFAWRHADASWSKITIAVP